MTSDSDDDALLLNCLRQRILRDGPIAVRDYMAACLTDAEHGYYRHRAPIGRDGDFVTAPEVSQIFGELIGIWAAALWQQLGRPRQWRLIELGPGRGTLMRDLLRALKVQPDCLGGLTVDLIDISRTLIAQQRATLQDSPVPVSWHAEMTADSRPALVIANEVLDALPVRQLVHASGQWRERLVGLDAYGRLQFQIGAVVSAANAPATSPNGAVYETRDGFPGVLMPLAAQARLAPIAALFIDYGQHGPLTGETLQAVRNQRYCAALETPGAADLSAHVDFGDLLAAARRHGLAAHGPITQAAFLLGLGLAQRLARLTAGADARVINQLEAGAARLVAPDAMGARFLAAAITTPGLLPPPFAPAR